MSDRSEKAGGKLVGIHAVAVPTQASRITQERPPMYAQQISTAPKDGTLILGMDHRGWREMWWKVGGEDYADYWQDNYDSEPEPTHWCPLPIIEK